MRDFQEFINGKIAVRVSCEKENIDFVKLCCKNGFKLGYPDYMDRFDKNKLWTVGRIFKDEIFNDNNDKSFLSEYKIVQASEFLQPQVTIEIFQSKQTVVCLEKENGKVIAKGVAKCSKDDVFNFDYGAELALNRMLKNKDKIIKQNSYKIGDVVMINKWTRNHIIDVKKYMGKKATIVDCECYGYRILEDEGRYIWKDNEIKGKVIE